MSQKTNSMIKLALVFFISLLSFSIGTYVGKKYSDNQHKLAALEPNKKEAHGEATGTEFATHAEGAAAAGKDGESAALTDSEVAKIAEEFATEQPAHADAADEKTIPTASADEHDIKTVAAKTPAPKAAKTLPAKSLTQAAAEQVNKLQTERDPASLPARQDVTPSSMQFTVQIGSFPVEGEAQKMTKDLQAKGYKTSYVAAHVNGQTWYRVNVGLFGSVKEAQDYRNDFLAKTKMTSALVQKIQ